MRCTQPRSGSTPAERGADPPLPPKVEAAIRRRLGGLSTPARELAQTATVLGRTFTVAALVRVSQDGAFIQDYAERAGIVMDLTTIASAERILLDVTPGGRGAGGELPRPVFGPNVLTPLPGARSTPFPVRTLPPP